MARPRVYRHDVRCPDCGSHWMPKDGHSKGRQRYKCGECHRSYLPEGAYHRPGPALKEHGLRMYLEGSSLSAVGGSPDTVRRRRWGGSKKGDQAITGRREWGRQRREGAREGQLAAVITWDEMWTYRGVGCGVGSSGKTAGFGRRW